MKVKRKDKGIKEIIEDHRESEKVEINPMIKSNYELLEKVQVAINQKPKMDIDQDAIKLADATEKNYQYFVDNNIKNENLFNMNLDEYNKILKEYNEAYVDFEKQDIKGGTTHTISFRDFQKAYHSFANNIVNMVNEKNFNSGKLDGPKGLVSPSDDEDIQERLYFYVDRLTSAYNSIQSLKK